MKRVRPPPLMKTTLMVTWLNLWSHFRLPKKVRRLIYSKLTPFDRAKVEDAHGVLNFKVLIEKSVVSGDLELLRWTFSKRPDIFHNLSKQMLFNLAVSHCTVSVISWMFETLVGIRYHDISRKFIFCRAAIAGNLDVMEWAVFLDSLDWLNSSGTSGQAYIDRLLADITSKGHLDVLKWFHGERRIRKVHLQIIRAIASGCRFTHIVEWVQTIE